MLFFPELPFRHTQLDARSDHQTRVAMGVCLSKRSELSPRVDAGGGSAASRPESTPQRVDEGYGARKLGALSRRLRTGDAAAANEHGREPQRRKIVKIATGDSEAMDTGASGLNPPMPREGYVGASARFPLFFPAFFPETRHSDSRRFLFFRLV